MIWIEDTEIKIGNVLLPGLLKSIDITGAAEVDEQELEGSSTKKKQAKGYEDAKINIELILEDGIHETKYFKLTKLQNLFRKPGQEKPIVYNIFSKQTVARNVQQVIFKTLTSKEDSARSQIVVTMEFWEYSTMTISATKSTTQTQASTAVESPKRPKVTLNEKGKAPKSSNKKKTAKSPAADTANGQKLAKLVRQSKK